MDRWDSALAKSVQFDSGRSIAKIADEIGLSSSACQRRLKLLEDRGVIEGYAARLNANKLGLGLHAFVEISLVSQSRDVLENFEQAVGTFDEILECHLMAGNADYLLRIAAADAEHLDSIHRNCLSRLPGVSSMRTSFSIRRIKDWRGYPIRP